MLENLRNYIEENNFKLIVNDNSIDIINYTRIISLESNYISIKTKNKKIIIKGNNLKPEKILDKEILVKGFITTIEVDNNE